MTLVSTADNLKTFDVKPFNTQKKNIFKFVKFSEKAFV